MPFLRDADSKIGHTALSMASSSDQNQGGPVSPAILILIFGALGLCLTAMCMGLGYVIMKDHNNACDSCYKSGDEAQEAQKN